MARGRRAEIRGRGGQRSAQLLDQRHRHLNVGRWKAAEGRRTPGRIRETRCSRLDFLANWAKNPNVRSLRFRAYRAAAGEQGVRRVGATPLGLRGFRYRYPG